MEGFLDMKMRPWLRRFVSNCAFGTLYVLKCHDLEIFSSKHLEYYPSIVNNYFFGFKLKSHNKRIIIKFLIKERGKRKKELHTK